MEEKSEIHQHHSGSGDNVGRDKITNIYINAKDFQELDEQLRKLKKEKVRLQERIAKYPEDDDFKADLLKVDAAIEDQECKIESFKSDVFRLYETFTKIEINTDRLRQAKAHFDKGEFREADALLNAMEISHEVSQLKQAKNRTENKLADINKNLENKANEFLVKAQLWKTFYSELDWFEKTCEYYEKALDASRTDDAVFQYAFFLHNHKQFTKAQNLYEEALLIYRKLAKENRKIYLSDVAMTLNNLAVLHSDKNEFAEALGKYEEALQIRRELAQENPRTYLAYVADTLNNLGELQYNQKEFGKALCNYEDALKIRRELAQENRRTYLPLVAMTLNNLANLQNDKNESVKALGNYKEALQIFREFSQETPRTYLPYVAGTLNNLANIQKTTNEFDEALCNYEEALKIRKELAQKNPRTYLPFVATTLSNLANLQKVTNEFGKALDNHKEALEIRRKLAQENHKAYLPDVAMSLNNLAVLQKATNEFVEALGSYEGALQIYRAFAQENPGTYLPNVAITLINLSVFYLQSVPDTEKSIAFAKEAVEILLPIYKQIPYLEEYLNTAILVLEANGVDSDELMKDE